MRLRLLSSIFSVSAPWNAMLKPVITINMIASGAAK